MAKPKGKGGLAVIIGLGAPRDGGPLPGSPEARRRHAADVEADFTGRPQPYGSYDAHHDADSKVPEQAAGYMELEGARKDGDCGLVEVAAGVSGELGCCNLFDPQAAARAFKCATCEHFEQPRLGAAAGAPAMQVGR